MRKKYSLLALLLTFVMAVSINIPVFAQEPEPDAAAIPNETAAVTEAVLDGQGSFESIGRIEDITLADSSGSARLQPVSVNTYYGKYHYYCQLPTVSQLVYDAILQSDLRNGPATKRVSIDLSAVPVNERLCGNAEELENFLYTTLQQAFAALQLDWPELSWLVWARWTYSWRGAFSFLCDVLTLEMTPEGVAQATQNRPGDNNYADTGDLQAITAAVEQAKAEIGNIYWQTAGEKAEAVHAWLCDNLTYTENDTGWRGFQTAYSALVLKETVCMGYAKAFKVLCDEYGVPCIIVVGQSLNENHAWNYVQLEDGQWYGVDATWDDRDNGSGYADTYLLKGSSVFIQDHQEGAFQSLWFAYPALNYADYTFNPDLAISTYAPSYRYYTRFDSNAAFSVSLHPFSPRITSLSGQVTASGAVSSGWAGNTFRLDTTYDEWGNPAPLQLDFIAPAENGKTVTIRLTNLIAIVDGQTVRLSDRILTVLISEFEVPEDYLTMTLDGQISSLATGDTISITLCGRGEGLNGAVSTSGLQCVSISNALSSTQGFVVLPNYGTPSVTYTYEITASLGERISFSVSDVTTAAGNDALPLPGLFWDAYTGTGVNDPPGAAAGSLSISGPSSVSAGEIINILITGEGEGVNGAVSASGLEILSISNASCSTQGVVLFPNYSEPSVVFTCKVVARPGEGVQFSITNATAAEGNDAVSIPGCTWSAQVIGGTAAGPQGFLGDLNLDGTLNLADAVTAACVLDGSRPVTDLLLQNGDLNRSGQIDIQDLLEITNLIRRSYSAQTVKPGTANVLSVTGPSGALSKGDTVTVKVSGTGQAAAGRLRTSGLELVSVSNALSDADTFVLLPDFGSSAVSYTYRVTAASGNVSVTAEKCSQASENAVWGIRDAGWTGRVRTSSADPSLQPIPIPVLPVIAGHQTGLMNGKTYFQKASGFSTMFYLRSQTSGRMARVSAPYVKDSSGIRFYPLNHGGDILFPRLTNGQLSAYCVYRDGMEIPVLKVSGNIMSGSDEMQSGKLNGKTFYVKTSGFSTMFYLKSQTSGRMARVSAPYITDKNGIRHYPVNYGGSVLFPQLTDGVVSAYTAVSDGAEVPVLTVI